MSNRKGPLPYGVSGCGSSSALRAVRPHAEEDTGVTAVTRLARLWRSQSGRPGKGERKGVASRTAAVARAASGRQLQQLQQRLWQQRLWQQQAVEAPGRCAAAGVGAAVAWRGEAAPQHVHARLVHGHEGRGVPRQRQARGQAADLACT
jgi:hypothetical protein